MDGSAREMPRVPLPCSVSAGQNGRSGPRGQLAVPGTDRQTHLVFFTWLHIGRKRDNHRVEMSCFGGTSDRPGRKDDFTRTSNGPGGHNT